MRVAGLFRQLCASAMMMVYSGWILLCVYLLQIFGHRQLGPTGWDIVDWHDHYYYGRIVDKMKESLSVSNCTMDTNKGSATHFPKNLAPLDGAQPDFVIQMYPPSDKIFKEWTKLRDAFWDGNRSPATRRLFIKVTHNLCFNKQFKQYRTGRFKRAKGCYKMYVTDPKTGLITKRINSYGATLHPDHSRCNLKPAMYACQYGRQHAVDYPWDYVSETPIVNTAFPFMITAKNVVVAKSGMLASPCGPFGLYASCEATNWGLPSARLQLQNVKSCRQDASTCPLPHYKQIFLGSQYDDTQIGQFILEALPKLVYHLDFIYANPEMKIHYGFTKKDVLPAFVLPHNIFAWLGLSDRLINGSYYADEAYMPREGGCQEPGYNMWEIAHMRDYFLDKAAKEIGIGGRNNSKGWGQGTVMANLREKALGPMDFHNDGDVDSDAHHERPIMIIVKRSSSEFTQNQGDFRLRRWPPKYDGVNGVRKAMQHHFPDHRIMIFSDQDDEMMRCMACTAQLFSRAQIVVGIHGAGLTNCVFMPPDGVVVEVVPRFDSRHAPVTGIFARLSGMNGLNHYSYYIGDDSFHPDLLANDTRIYFDEIMRGQPRRMPHVHEHEPDIEHAV